MAIAQAEDGRSSIQRFIAALKPWPRRGLTLAAGALATLGHAPFQFVPAYVAAIVILVWMLDAAAERPKRIASAVLTGLLFGFGRSVLFLAPHPDAPLCAGLCRCP